MFSLRHGEERRANVHFPRLHLVRIKELLGSGAHIFTCKHISFECQLLKQEHLLKENYINAGLEKGGNDVTTLSLGPRDYGSGTE